MAPNRSDEPAPIPSKVLTRYDFTERRGRPRGSRYDHLLDGRTHRIEAHDSTLPLDRLRNSLYVTAGRRGMRLRAFIDDGALVVQAIPDDDDGNEPVAA